MRKTLLFTLIIFILVSMLASCTVNEELRFGTELRDINLGFTTGNFSVACIVSHPEMVNSLNVTLINQNNVSFSLQTDDIATITSLSFTEILGGSYDSTCTVCDQQKCRSSESGIVLVSIENDIIDSNNFDLPPSLILGTPIDNTYFLSGQSLVVSFSCLSKDDVGLTAASLVSDVSGVFSETYIQNPSKSSYLLTKDLVLEPGNYLWTCRATDTRAQTVLAPIRRFIIGPATEEILPNIEGFDGATTDFSNLPTLTNVPEVVIEVTEFGKISFVDNISSLVGVDFSKGIIITKDSITVNSSLYPQLNVSAELSFYDIDFDENVEEASIEKDGSTYSVKDLYYDNGTLSFMVGNFSTYTVVITPQGGYNLEETEIEKEEQQKELELDIENSSTIILNSDSETEHIYSDDTNVDSDDELVKDDIDIINDSNNETNKPKNNSIFDNDNLVGEIDDVGSDYFNPLVLAGIIVGFIIVIIIVVWFIKKKSNERILRKY